MSESSGFETLATRTVADLQFLKVTVRDVRTPGGDVVERVVIEHPGAVAVVPIIGEDILLIEQYREPMRSTVLEIPAGKLDDPSKNPEETAQQELEEEIGYRAASLSYLSEVWTTVGFSDERIHLYLGEDLIRGTRAPVGHEEAEARIVRMPFARAVDMVISGEISDAKSVVAILLAAHRGSP